MKALAIIATIFGVLLAIAVLKTVIPAIASLAGALSGITV